MVHDSVKHFILDQIRTDGVGEMTDKHVHKYFEAGEAAEAAEKKLLHSEELPALITSFAQRRTMNALADQR